MTVRRQIIAGILMLTVASACIGILTKKTVNADEIQNVEKFTFLKTFTEALAFIRNYYVEEVNMKDFIHGAIEGGLKTLDNDSSFLTSEMVEDMKADSKTGERLASIGVQLAVKRGMITVIAPVEGSPAHKAGIKPGDNIIKIDGESTEDMSLSEAVKRLQGAPKTNVTVTILRRGWDASVDVTLMRDNVTSTRVKSEILAEGVGYIRVSQFSEETASDLSHAMESLAKAKVNSLLLDLRGNPGGLLSAAVEVAQHFLPPDKLIVYTKSRGGKKTEYFTKKEKTCNVDIPLVVLIDQGSAGSSEIVAGALKEWKRAVILGTKTFGRGTIQTVIPLSDGSSLRLTTARFYTPKDVSIQSAGITPDIIEERADLQLKRAIDLIKTEKELKL